MKANELKKFRTDRDLTQQEFADMLGVRKQTILRWENGHFKIPKAIELLLKLMGKEHRE